MFEDLKPYPKYREAEGEWLGKVPDHWSVKRVKYLLTEVDQRSLTGKEQLLRVSQYTGVTQRLSKYGDSEPDTRAESLVGYKIVSKDNLVVNIMLAWNGSMGVSKYSGIASPAYCVYNFKNNASPWYYHHLFRAPSYKARIKALSTGVVESRLRLYTDSFFRMEALIPPPEEQEAIVRFLDFANAKLEKAIRSKKKIIALLNEQKQALIHQAVTKGLDPKAKMKDSGIPWLGEIPAHWEVKRFKTIAPKIDQGISPQASRYLAEGNSWGVLKSGCVNGGVFREREHKQLPPNFTIDPQIIVREGDILISRACGSVKFVGSVGKVSSLSYKLILSDKLFRPHFIKSCHEQFIVYAMNSPYYRLQVEQAISGAEGMANNLPLTSLKSFLILLPPRTEAQEISVSISKEIDAIHCNLESLKNEIALIEEYRTRLVADVVTGKLDVREAAKKLPKDLPELEESPDDDEAIDEENESDES